MRWLRKEEEKPIDPPKEKAIDIKDVKSGKVESIPLKEDIAIIKQVFLSFMPEDSIEDLRGFKNSNAEALKTLKELDAMAFGEVSTAFLARADKIKTNELGE